MVLNNKKPIKLYSETKLESVLLGINDLIGDLFLLSFKCEFVKDKKDADFIFAIDESFSHQEEYCYQIAEDRIHFFGQNDLGLLWAIYSFLSDELHIPPFYKFDGFTIKPVEEVVVDKKIVNNYPKTRFRGWFINDEDLLEGFKKFGHRDVDYIYYQNVIHPEVFSLVIETCLRYRYNLIIPSTLIDLKNEDERLLVEMASKRGLYISQHHIEPLGVSNFAMERFFKKEGNYKDFSYISNKSLYLKCWEEYANLWSKYPRVVYQLGLRGRGDKPFWHSENNSVHTDEEKANVINSVIEEQQKILKKCNRNKELYFSFTLWMESADLLKKNLLHIPDDTIVVFSDLGLTSLPGDDVFIFNFNQSKYKYGYYFHLAYFHVGAHLNESICPQKMSFSYKLLEKPGLFYSIINVANVKEFTFSIFLNSEILFNEDYNLDDGINKYIDFYNVADNKIFRKMIDEYYLSMTDGLNSYYKDFCEAHNFSYHEYNNLDFPVFNISDGFIIWFIKRGMEERTAIYCPRFHNSLCDSLKHIDLCINEMEKLKIKENKAFLQKWTYTILSWKQMVLAATYIFDSISFYKNKDFENLFISYKKASESLSKIILLRKKYFNGYFKNWFNGDKKTGINDMIQFLNCKINNREI